MCVKRVAVEAQGSVQAYIYIYTHIYTYIYRSHVVPGAACLRSVVSQLRPS